MATQRLRRIHAVPDEEQTAPQDPYRAAAEEFLARLAALADEFFPKTKARPLTRAEMRLATVTTGEFLEAAATYAEAKPEIGALVRPGVLRAAIARDIAFMGPVRAVAALHRRMRHDLARKKLEAVKSARGLYRVAKGYATTDDGDSTKVHVARMKQTLTPRKPRRKKKTRSPGK